MGSKSPSASHAAASAARHGSSSGTVCAISARRCCVSPTSARASSAEVVPSVALHGASYGEEVLAFDVGRERANAELLGERQDAVLGRADPPLKGSSMARAPNERDEP